MFLSRRLNGIYYIHYSDTNGKRCKVSTECSNKKDATQLLKSYKVKEVVTSKTTLLDFQEEYLNYITPLLRPNSVLSVRLAFKEFYKLNGNVLIKDITIREVERFLSYKLINTSVWSARKYHVTLASAFNRAVKWNLITTNPFSEVKPPKAPDVNHVIFSHTDFIQLLDSTPTRLLRDIFTFALLTGMRLSEISNLKSENIDISKRVIHITNTDTFKTKNQKNRTIPINTQLLEMLKDKRSGYVFNIDGNQISGSVISKRLKKSVLEAKLNPKLHFHSLRHSFATWMIEKNVNMYVVSKILGHQSVVTTETFYAKFDVTKYHNEINSIAI